MNLEDTCTRREKYSNKLDISRSFIRIFAFTMADKQSLKEQVALLPLQPGVYQFLDRTGTIIYVGKAKSLRKRVSSYFVESKEHSAKVRVLVKQIVEIRHIVVDTEQDALLLENSLIKSLQPRYNILLKDDKTYPWIVVRREHFPRVQSTRQLVRDGSQYYGPYSSISMQRSVLEFIREVIPLRTCKLNLSAENIARGKYGVCLEYHIGNCKGPCIGAQSEEEYAAQLDLVHAILKGDLRPVRQYLTREMERAATELRFEQAQGYKQRLDALDNYAGRSVIVSAKISDVDIFSLLVDDDVAYCNFVRIRHGSIARYEIMLLGLGTCGVFGQYTTFAQGLYSHIAVHGRVDPVQSVCRNDNRRYACFYSGFVRCDIYPVCQSANNGQIGHLCCQIQYELSAPLLAALAGHACSNYAHHTLGIDLHIAFGV